LRSPPYADPRLSVVNGHELPLSGVAVLELMRAVLAMGVPFRFCARGWSMAPFIRDGDVITVAPLAGPPGLGEVVAFVRPEAEMLVVHRVVAIRGDAPLIQGDSVPECTDGVIPLQNILGRVTRVERQGQAVWLGLGPERLLIAWLSRSGLLGLLRARLPALFIRTFLRRWG